MSLETERSLTEAKYEVAQLRKEVQFLTANRGDLEACMGAIAEEKRMLERELLALRAQIQTVKNGGNNTLRFGSTLTG